MRDNADGVIKSLKIDTDPVLNRQKLKHMKYRRSTVEMVVN